MNVRDGQQEAGKALTAEMCEGTSAETGAVQYEWFYTHDGGKCHILEEYEDSAAAVAHLQNFLTKYVERFMGCFEPTAVNVYGDPSDELNELMQPFGPVYFGGREGFVH
mgnify:CR=1 FL=1